MKKYIFIFYVGLLPYIVSAADPLVYKLAAPIPGGGSEVKTFTQYISFLFPFMLSIAAISALVMFILGGIQYTLGGANPEQMKSGKERISNAIWGLLLAVFSVLILQTINPKLVLLSLDLGEPAGVVSNNNTPGGPPPGGGPLANGSSCGAGSECQSGVCEIPDSDTVKRCLPSNLGIDAECDHPAQCTSHQCYQGIIPPQARKYCH